VSDFGAGGILPVDKPEGPTSHDVVQMARRALRERRIGHTGTLDPFASGLMLLCVGRATRIAEFLTGLDKTYQAVARLGVRTDTLDRDGEVVREDEGWRELDPARVERVLADTIGTSMQVPPQFSARKVEGVRMHRRARRGEHVELEPRPITIHAMDLVELDLPLVRFRLRCSSGTYVRAIARDVGESLGVGAHLTELRRTAVGSFGVEGAVHPDRLSDAEQVRGAWMEPLRALVHLPCLDVDEEAVSALRQGREISTCHPVPGSPVVAAFDERLVAVGEVLDGTFRPRKVFVQ